MAGFLQLKTAPARLPPLRGAGFLYIVVICSIRQSEFELLEEALMSITTRALTPQDWQTFRRIRLRALCAHPDVYSGSYGEAAARSERDWIEMLDGNGKCIFGLFDGNRIIGIAAVFTSRADPDGQSGVLAMDYIDPSYRGWRLSKLLYQARIDWAKQHPPFRRLVVAHREGNEPSRRANQSFGFKFVGKDEMDWPDGTNAPEYIYELDLVALRNS